jgi:hypothetical protein
MRVTLLFCLALTVGCQKTASVPVPLSPERLRMVFPALTTPFVAREFRARAGLVTQHVRNAGRLVGTLSIEDLLDEPEQRAMFAEATQRVQNCPALSTSMGGGMALLYENRFKVEAVALDPAVSDDMRRGWLEGFRLETLKESTDK